MKVTATNKITGEVIELEADTPAQIADAWLTAAGYEKLAAGLKDQLKKIVPTITGAKGVSEPIGTYQFRVSAIQRMTYDKAVMRDLLDPDTFDVLLKPDKPLVDEYLKDNLESLGEASTRLRQAMIPDGKPFQSIRLEKVARDE